MGAGAGYNIRGTIDSDSIKVNSFEVMKSFIATDDLGGGHTMDYQVIQIKCDIDCAAEDVSSESYYYGGTLHGFTPIKITEMSLISEYDDIEDISEIDESVIMDALDSLKFDCSLGGGWSHAKFTGDISCDTKELDENSYADFYFNEIIMHITSQYAVRVLDEYAAGDNYAEHYLVVDAYGDILADDFYDDLDSAIEFAKENNGYQVLSEKMWYTYEVLPGGDIDVWDSDVEDYTNVEWENPNYIDED